MECYCSRPTNSCFSTPTEKLEYFKKLLYGRIEGLDVINKRLLSENRKLRKRVKELDEQLAAVKTAI